ncbi:hypothetical protein [Microbacterium sp. 22296]|uniref:hypothetical protein n=1 Tax=Microbacterium sp. 22296 TaxID=3453903 RepID=UPI003F8667E9
MRGAVGQVLGVVGGLWGRVMGFFSGAGSWLYNTGRDLILGLGNGIASMAQNVINSISNVVNGAIDWAKKTLGIASPSKLFRSFGVFVGEGLVLGLASMQGAVGDEFQRMVQFPASSVGALTFDSVALNTLVLDSVGVVGSGGESGGTTINNTTKNVTYVAAENQSLSSEEAVYAALGSPRVRE